jgi:hypothetical protein
MQKCAPSLKWSAHAYTPNCCLNAMEKMHLEVCTNMRSDEFGMIHYVYINAGEGDQVAEGRDIEAAERGQRGRGTEVVVGELSYQAMCV